MQHLKGSSCVLLCTVLSFHDIILYRIHLTSYFIEYTFGQSVRCLSFFSSQFFVQIQLQIPVCYRCLGFFFVCVWFFFFRIHFVRQVFMKKVNYFFFRKFKQFFYNSSSLKVSNLSIGNADEQKRGKEWTCPQLFPCIFNGEDTVLHFWEIIWMDVFMRWW